jgi:hypothetical protein
MADKRRPCETYENGDETTVSLIQDGTHATIKFFQVESTLTQISGQCVCGCVERKEETTVAG